jgi:hypothetical protein
MKIYFTRILALATVVIVLGGAFAGCGGKSPQEKNQELINEVEKDAQAQRAMDNKVLDAFRVSVGIDQDDDGGWDYKPEGGGLCSINRIFTTKNEPEEDTLTDPDLLVLFDPDGKGGVIIQPYSSPETKIQDCLATAASALGWQAAGE